MAVKVCFWYVSRMEITPTSGGSVMMDVSMVPVQILLEFDSVMRSTRLFLLSSGQECMDVWHLVQLRNHCSLDERV